MITNSDLIEKGSAQAMNLISAQRAILSAWFCHARVLRRQGLLARAPEGEPVHWFWFRYIGKSP